MEKEFDHMPISHLVFRLGVPAMLAQFVNVLYSVVDRIFVGHIPDVGALAIAGIGVCSPILTAITAFASLIGIGGASVMSFSVGKRDKDSAKIALSNSFLILTIISLLLTAILLVFQRPILYLLGCSDTLYPYAKEYFNLYALGTIASLIGMGMNQFVLAQGYSKLGMLAVIIGAFTNTVLDPLFIFFFHMGIRGAALATVTSLLLPVDQQMQILVPVPAKIFVYAPLIGVLSLLLFLAYLFLESQINTDL